MAGDTEDDAWCDEQRLIASEYLSQQPGPFGALGEWPAWHVSPYCAIWAVESVRAPGRMGWWVITGDLPTDYASAGGVPTPRDAARAFAHRWRDASRAMVRGEEPHDVSVGTSANRVELGELLASRAQVLAQWVEDDAAWN